MKRPAPAPAQPIVWQRADPAALKAFDPRTKQCSMNCGPSSYDPRTSAERKLLCDECYDMPVLLSPRIAGRPPRNVQGGTSP